MLWSEFKGERLWKCGLWKILLLGCNGDYPLEMALDKAGWLFVVQENGVACSLHSIEAPLPTWGLGDSC